MKKVQENQKNQKKKNKGFTLVELIIVIAIIAILAIVLAPQYIKYVEKSRWSNDVNQMSELENMVKTAVVEATENNNSASVTGSLTANNAGITATNAASLVTQLNKDDPNWSSYKLKNNGKHASEAGLSTGNTSEYVVTVSYDSAAGAYDVKGSWKN